MPERRTTVALTRAAEQERQKLESDRERIVERARSVSHELEALSEEIRALDSRIRLLDALLAAPDADDPTGRAPLPTRVLRGAELREQATMVLAERAGVRTSVDYKLWFKWVQEAGFVVLGKRPLATFLTSINRSPVVQRGEEPGSYWLDPSAGPRLRDQLGELQGELNDLNAVIQSETRDRPDLVSYRTKLLASVRRVKRNLTEAETVLATPRSISAARRSRDVA